MHILALTGFIIPAVAPMTTVIQEEHAHVAFEVVVLPQTDGFFAPAEEDLALAWPEDSDGLSLLDVVNAYGAATGQRLAIGKDTRDVLAQMKAPIDRATPVPAAEVQGFFEALLRSSDCVLTVDRASEPRLVGVHSLHTQRRNAIRSRAMNIDSAHIDVLRRHPAVLFTTVLDLPNSDVRQLSNSLRTLITDSNTQQMVPAGNSHSMVITGFGTNLATTIEQLRAVDAESANARVAVSHELFRLKNAKAGDIASIVEAALTASREMRTPHQDPRGQPRPPEVHVSVLANVRLNGLLVTCRDEDLDEARAVIAQLDVK